VLAFQYRYQVDKYPTGEVLTYEICPPKMLHFETSLVSNLVCNCCCKLCTHVYMSLVSKDLVIVTQIDVIGDTCCINTIAHIPWSAKIPGVEDKMTWENSAYCVGK